MSYKDGLILVVDDNRMSRLKLSRSLEQHGYTVVVAESGIQALQKLRDASINLVFLDCVMPDMNGDDVLIAMQNEATLKDIPVIMIASPQDEVKIDNYLAIGAVDYIPQAFDATTLKAHVEAHLNHTVDESVEKQSFILVVDDDEFTRIKISRTLAYHKYTIFLANDGEQALKIVQTQSFDLILLDIILPGIDGFEICRRLMSNSATREIPIIFMTALTDVDDKVKGFELGAVDYITKPIQPEEMVARVNTHLRLRRLTGRLKEAYAREQQRRQLSDTLREVAKIVSSTLEQEQVFDLILSQLEKVVIYHRASIILLDGERLQVVAVHSDSGKIVDPKTITVSYYPLNELVLTEKRPILIPDTRADTRWVSRGYPLRVSSFIGAPLLMQDRPIGLLGISRTDGIAYTEDDSQTVFAFALQVAMAVENTRLMEQMQIELTERTRAEIALQRANQELIKLNADKDKFFSILAHDLKGPFMPLLGNLQLLMSSAEVWSQDEIRTMTSSMYISAKRVMSLLESILEWARLQMGRMSYNPSPLNLTEIVERNIYLMGDGALRKKLQLINQLEPFVAVEADESMIDTVFRNLLSNAIKFTPQGGQIILSTKLHPLEGGQPDDEPPSPRFVAVSVRDTGVGISQAEVEKIFTIGGHHSTIGTDEEQGTGLGLVICREMIHRHGGQIWVESEVGHGTTFTFTIPLHSSE